MSLNLAFKALNDGTRREILDMLRKKDLSAGEIADHFSISAPSISHHLEILRNAGLIESQKKGQFVIYSLQTTVLDDIMEWMVKFRTKTK
jgi:ArsR family transcriptional regulator, arsenate/arsenite/antimonite-responsive transcriptional repressor